MSDQKRYQMELQAQMDEQRLRKEAEEKADKLDWWEKREAKVEPTGQRPKTKQHPSQVHKEKKYSNVFRRLSEIYSYVPIIRC